MAPLPPQAAFEPPAVQLWRMQLDLPSPQIHALAEILSLEERMRADGFRFEQDRSRFIAAHGRLRLILSAYLRCQPQDLRFGVEPTGKPHLIGPSSQPSIHFNLSHSGQWAILAVGRQEHIGVDVEQVRPMVDLDHVAARVLSPAEQAILTNLAGQEKLEHFFAMWTRREAAAKATGMGLGAALQSLQISPADPAETHAFQAAGGETSPRLYGECFTAAQGYPAAVAVCQSMPIELILMS